MSLRLFALLASILLLTALLILPFAASGCTAAGAAAYVLMGDAPVDAQYILPRVSTLVLVENYTNADATQDDADVLTHYIIDDLKKHLNNKKKEEKKKELPIVFIDPQKIYDLRTLDSRKYHRMKIQDIGRAVGARQVIYVSLDSVDVQNMGGTEIMRGVGSARVKVINTVTGQTQWPAEFTGGYPVGFQSKLVTPQENISYDQARDRTMRTTAQSISRLFYKYNPGDDDEDDDFSPSS